VAGFLRFCFLCVTISLASCEDPRHFNGYYTIGIDYPKRDIQLVIPFGKGSSSDQFARHFAAMLSHELPVDILPINIEGAGGLVGMIETANSAPDGYSILEITPSHIISDVLHRSEIQLREAFDPLALVQKDYYLLLSGTKKPGPSLQSLLNDKKRSYTIGGISPQGLDEMTMQVLARAFNVTFVFVPYPSGHELRAAALSREVDFILGKMIANLKHIRAGRLKAELLLHGTRLRHIPEMEKIPASGELGLEVEIQSWRGFAVHKAVPKHVKDYLVERIRHVYYSERYQQYIAQHLGTSYEDFAGPRDFASFWEDQHRFFSRLHKE
jgi:tripartite-type tricarboxylate transporter receptor subunit TctC